MRGVRLQRQDTGFGQADHTVLIWDCSRALADVKPLPEPSAKQLEEWWQSLASSQALAARQAMAQLVRCPGPATQLLGDHLKPATAADPERVAALIRDLSDSEFNTRHEPRTHWPNWANSHR